jgi:Kef-type K+ transport system membrane component KefB
MIAGVTLGPTSLSTLSLTAGAFDDAMSWCVLAVVPATFGARPGIAVLAIGGGVSYAAFLMQIGEGFSRHSGKWWGAKAE